jgi:hypothetical protein
MEKENRMTVLLYPSQANAADAFIKIKRSLKH